MINMHFNDQTGRWEEKRAQIRAQSDQDPIQMNGTFAAMAAANYAIADRQAEADRQAAIKAADNVEVLLPLAA